MDLRQGLQLMGSGPLPPPRARLPAACPAHGRSVAVAQVQGRRRRPCRRVRMRADRAAGPRAEPRRLALPPAAASAAWACRAPARAARRCSSAGSAAAQRGKRRAGQSMRGTLASAVTAPAMLLSALVRCTAWLWAAPLRLGECTLRRAVPCRCGSPAMHRQNHHRPCHVRMHRP